MALPRVSFLKASDLPEDPIARDRMILAAMEGVGSGDPRQIDGLGGATSLTSKVAVVSRSKTAGCDLDYLFLQVIVGAGQVSTGQNCGNILAAFCHSLLRQVYFHPVTRLQQRASTWSIQVAFVRSRLKLRAAS